MKQSKAYTRRLCDTSSFLPSSHINSWLHEDASVLFPIKNNRSEHAITLLRENNSGNQRFSPWRRPTKLYRPSILNGSTLV